MRIASFNLYQLEKPGFFMFSVRIDTCGAGKMWGGKERQKALHLPIWEVYLWTPYCVGGGGGNMHKGGRRQA